MRGFGMISAFAIGGILGVGFLSASREEAVYGKTDHYRIERRPDAEGRDRIFIFAAVPKLLNCDVESGDGPPWVDFFDGDEGAGVPPPSAFYRPDMQPAGSTIAKGGEVAILDGYSAIVPNKMREIGGTFVIRVPCQRWEYGPDGHRVWDRKIVASWGPVPVPKPGETVGKLVDLYEEQQR